MFGLSLLVIGCGGFGSPTAGLARVSGQDSSTEIFNFPIDKFSLSYDSSLQRDDNSLVFLKTIPFDTSYLIQVKAKRSGAVGACYFVSPGRHRDLEDYADEKKLLSLKESVFA